MHACGVLEANMHPNITDFGGLIYGTELSTGGRNVNINCASLYKLHHGQHAHTVAMPCDRTTGNEV